MASLPKYSLKNILSKWKFFLNEKQWLISFIDQTNITLNHLFIFDLINLLYLVRYELNAQQMLL